VDAAEDSRWVATAPPQTPSETRKINFIPYDQAYAVGFEDMRKRVPDITRIRELTGWQPKRSLEITLKDVVEQQVHD
jgi:UDP-glucose 4-epimerase